MNFKPGQVLDSKYVLLQLLGEGAMGVVFAAQDLERREKRAIKIMRAGLLGDREQTERFRREARSAARLESAHVCKVLDVGKQEDGVPYLVMEHLEGHDLKTELKERRRLPVADAVRYILQACDAIGEAHRLGIVHRDLKPANLFLAQQPDGETSLKVLDFGIAKVSKVGAVPGTIAQITQHAQMLGTPAYMSPEQMRAARDVDGRADLWSLGVILYRMLTLEMPFPGADALDLITAVLSVPPVPASMRRRDIPSGLDAAILRCLEKDPAKRFQTAEELAAAIAPFVAIRAVSVGRVGVGEGDGSDETATIALARPLARPGNRVAPAMMVGGGTVRIAGDAVAAFQAAGRAQTAQAVAAEGAAGAEGAQKRNPWMTTLPLDMKAMPEANGAAGEDASAGLERPRVTDEADTVPLPVVGGSRRVRAGAVVAAGARGRWRGTVVGVLGGLLVSIAVLGALTLGWWFLRGGR